MLAVEFAHTDNKNERLQATNPSNPSQTLVFESLFKSVGFELEKKKTPNYILLYNNISQENLTNHHIALTNSPATCIYTDISA